MLNAVFAIYVVHSGPQISIVTLHVALSIDLHALPQL